MERILVWLGSSLDDLRDLPDVPKRAIGFALRRVQDGEKPDNAKQLQGFGGASVLEIVENYDTDAYRTVYTVRFEEAVYVLHAFQKKSTSGVATPKSDLELVKKRLRQAEQEHQKWQEQQSVPETSPSKTRRKRRM